MLLRILVIMMAVTFYAACSSSKKSTAVQAVAISSSDSLTGLDGIKKNDCITCHSFSRQLTGPSFSAIAKKYDATAVNVDKLARKIITGGSGSWSQLPMTPHSSMSDETARSVVKYILSLKK
jgi:cytochrome c